MNELIHRLKEITNLSELENIDNIDSNSLFYAVAKSGRYDLLKKSNIRLNINDTATLEKLTDFLLSDDDLFYNGDQYEFSFSTEELNSMFNIII